MAGCAVALLTPANVLLLDDDAAVRQHAWNTRLPPAVRCWTASRSIATSCIRPRAAAAPARASGDVLYATRHLDLVTSGAPASGRSPVTRRRAAMHSFGVRPAWTQWRLAAVVAVICVAVLAVLSSTTAGSSPGGSVPRLLAGRVVISDASSDDLPLEAPAGYGRADSAALVEAFIARGGQVVAFIFFGRRRYTAVQWPHLLAARRSAGSGVLSQVIYAANTDDKDDLAWLDALQASHSDFVQIRRPERVASLGKNGPDFCALYRQVVSNNASDTLVIKVRLSNTGCCSIRAHAAFCNAHVFLSDRR